MRWSYVATSVIGSSHLKKNIPCQDYCLTKKYTHLDGDESLISVLSDGAGCAKYSHYGSRLVCRLAVKHIKSWFNEGNNISSISKIDILNLINNIKLNLDKKAYNLHLNSGKDLACTFLLSFIGKGRSIFVQIGDGAIIYNKDGALIMAFQPRKGEFHNLTEFITDQDSSHKTQILIVDAESDELAMISDGLELLAIDNLTSRPHEPFFKPLLNHINDALNSEIKTQLEIFLKSDRINDRTDDDKSLILATKKYSSEI